MLRAHPLLLQLALPLQSSLVDLVGVGVQSADDSQRLHRHRTVYKEKRLLQQEPKDRWLECCSSQQLQSEGRQPQRTRTAAGHAS